MKQLRIARDLAFPPDVVTQTLLVVGKRGSGKSNTAARLVEQLHASQIPFVVLDPVDTWWGLKAGRDGGPGLEGIYVFGGKHADVPLEAGERSGALIAELLCEHQLSIVLSVKHLSGRERSAFMVAFAQTLFQKWSGGPLHVVLEEAHELAPQNTQNAKEGEQQMLGAFKRLWKLGRASGIGGTAVTQRPASLSKDITTQSEILVAHRTVGPQDVKAIGEWIKYHGERSDILGELPTLPTGDAYVWGPEFPSDKPIGLRRVSVLLRETYDSASTPKVGERRVEPKELAPADLARLRAKMASTIERAKAEDPKELQKRIRDLEAQLRKGAAPVHPKSEVDQSAVDRAVARAVADERRRQERYRRVLQTSLKNVLGRIRRGEAELQAAADLVTAADTEIETNWMPAAPAAAAAAIHVTAPIRPTRDREPVREVATADGVRRPQQRMLNALATLKALGVDPVKRNIVAALSNQSPRSSGWDKNCSTLRTAGLISYPTSETMALTSAGEGIAQADDTIGSVADVHAAWKDIVSGPQWRMLEALIAVHPDAMDRNALAAASHQSSSSSGWDKNLSTLRSLGLIDYPSTSEAVATDLLFPRGLQ